MTECAAPFAPIAVFAFKRPVHLQRTLAALAGNPEFAQSPLHIFCDGARRPDEEDLVAQTRTVARGCLHPNKVVVEAPANQGLARSVIAGVSRLCEAHGRVIVVEDDLKVAPSFLSYMNRALNHYADAPDVMQISGHMFDVDLPAEADAVFLPFITSWGWATWARAWKHFDPEMRAFEKIANDSRVRRRFDLDGAYPYFAMLKRQREGTVDSWAVRWYLSVFMAGGLVLYPRRSLVINEGFDGTGTHGALRSTSRKSVPPARLVAVDSPMPPAQVDERAFASVRAYLRKDNSATQRILRKLRAKLA